MKLHICTTVNSAVFEQLTVNSVALYVVRIAQLNYSNFPLMDLFLEKIFTKYSFQNLRVNIPEGYIITQYKNYLLRQSSI